ncbi:MAG: response regulator transcription factor [Reyranella sp.]
MNREGIHRIAAPAPYLTPREEEVLRLVRQGRSNAEIAQTLGCAVKTAEHHVTNLLDKTGCRGRIELARWRAPDVNWSLQPV